MTYLKLWVFDCDLQDALLILISLILISSNLLALILLIGKDTTIFLETSNLNRGFDEDNAHRKSASLSSSCRDFVLSALF